MPPEWFWKGLTIIIAAWAAWSAWQQHHVARDKLRLAGYAVGYVVHQAAVLCSQVRDLDATCDSDPNGLQNLSRRVLPRPWLFLLCA